MTQVTIEAFTKFCGPAAVASALEITREEAVRRIQIAGWEGRKGGTNGRQIAAAVGSVAASEGVLVMEESERPQRKFLTATQWLKANPDAHAIIGTRTHWLHVRNGKVVEDNGTWRPRARVEIRIPLGHMQIVEAMWKEMLDDLLVARAEMLVARRRMERLRHLLERYKNEPDRWSDMLRELTAVHTG